MHPRSTARVYATIADKARRAVAAGHCAIVDARLCEAAGAGRWRSGPPEHWACPSTACSSTPISPPGFARVGARSRDASDADAAVARAQESYDLGALDWTRVDASGTPEETLARARARSAVRLRDGLVPQLPPRLRDGAAEVAAPAGDRDSAAKLHRSYRALDCIACVVDPRKIAVATAGFCAFLNLYSPQALLPALAREFGVGAAEISTIMTASALAIALTAPFTGAIADVLGEEARHHRRHAGGGGADGGRGAGARRERRSSSGASFRACCCRRSSP